jgi:hypothetical protein
MSEFFNFAVYIRMTTESYQLMLFSSVSEINSFELKDMKYSISLVLSFVI